MVKRRELPAVGQFEVGQRMTMTELASGDQMLMSTSEMHGAIAELSAVPGSPAEES